jgi:hypothetical protein
VEEQLASWLNESAVAAGDDVSMALIHRSSAERPVAVVTTAATPTVAPPVASDPARRGPWGVVAAAVITAALVGGIAGWLLADDSDESVAVVATSGPVESMTVSTTTEPRTTEPTNPDRTDPDRSGPPTSDPAVPTASTEIGPQDQVMLFVGVRESDDDDGTQLIGVVLAFDQTTPNARAQSLGEPVSVDENTTLTSRRLPAGWEQRPGGVSFEGWEPDEREALAVGYLGQFFPYVWVVEPDGTTLSWYDAESGDREGQSPITPAIDPDMIGEVTRTGPSSGSSGSPTSSPPPSESAQE